ncbi:MAG: AtpZ/AtpI family protein [Deltaproteobacteria bacterium]|nr:AtpZ/AtpI family protein [Deltaproteobacteria bacterium]
MAKENPFVIYGRFAALGFEFAFSTVAGILVGRYLDGLFGTAPWLLVVGAMGGIAGAILILVNTLQRMSHDAYDNDRED